MCPRRYGHLCRPAESNALLRASAGYDHALALAKNSLSGPAGRFGLIGWGRNDLGQSTVPNLTAGPWFIEPTAQVADLQAGEYINLVLFDNGQIAAWGHNWYGVDPRSSLSGAAPLFQAYSPPSDWRFRQIACGGHFVAALRDNGEIVCWGMFDYRAPHEGPLVWGPGYRGTMPQSDPAAIPSWYAPYSPPYVRIAAGHVALMGL